MIIVAVVLAGVILLLAVIIVGIAMLLPVASEAAERVRVEREVAEASWKIHQQATTAFGQMLGSARQHDQQDQS